MRSNHRRHHRRDGIMGPKSGRKSVVTWLELILEQTKIDGAKDVNTSTMLRLGLFAADRCQK